MAFGSFGGGEGVQHCSVDFVEMTSILWVRGGFFSDTIPYDRIKYRVRDPY